MFDYMGIMLDKNAFSDRDFTVNFVLENGEKHMIQIKNGVLLHYDNVNSKSADIKITCPKNALFFILQNNKDGLNQVAQIEGDSELFELFMNSMNQLDTSIGYAFNIIEP